MPNIGGDMVKLKTSYIAGGIVKWQPLWKTI